MEVYRRDWAKAGAGRSPSIRADGEAGVAKARAPGEFGGDTNRADKR